MSYNSFVAWKGAIYVTIEPSTQQISLDPDAYVSSYIPGTMTLAKQYTYYSPANYTPMYKGRQLDLWGTLNLNHAGIGDLA
ncbi:uncharacterized protein RAG0_15240 [Rhynchosporium agropyri]|uniref:Uncharacterized protein n=1 Tax=Rhynchosporium agropyri TaxID=914238 RepID=A0A1E1LK88_9HELO|nr:uncharacterized protein RAG0_15240 [Rhynchosporium agropyri]